MLHSSASRAEDKLDILARLHQFEDMRCSIYESTVVIRLVWKFKVLLCDDSGAIIVTIFMVVGLRLGNLTAIKVKNQKLRKFKSCSIFIIFTINSRNSKSSKIPSHIYLEINFKRWYVSAINRLYKIFDDFLLIKNSNSLSRVKSKLLKFSWCSIFIIDFNHKFLSQLKQ